MWPYSLPEGTSSPKSVDSGPVRDLWSSLPAFREWSRRISVSPVPARFNLGSIEFDVPGLSPFEQSKDVRKVHFSHALDGDISIDPLEHRLNEALNLALVVKDAYSFESVERGGRMGHPGA